MSTQLRVGPSKLNFHKFEHNFRDTLNPLCPINDGIEDTGHFLLLCHKYDHIRCDLLGSVDTVLRHHGLTNLPNKTCSESQCLAIRNYLQSQIKKFSNQL